MRVSFERVAVRVRTGPPRIHCMRDAGPYLRTCHEHRTNSFEVSTAVSKQRFAPDSSRLTLSTGAARRERRYRKIGRGDAVERKERANDDDENKILSLE